MGFVRCSSPNFLHLLRLDLLALVLEALVERLARLDHLLELLPVLLQDLLVRLHRRQLRLFLFLPKRKDAQGIRKKKLASLSR